MSVSVYQIQYSDNVIGGFDPDFKKYDCRAHPESAKREIAHMQRFFNEGIWKDNDSQYIGLVSPKFNEKCKLRGNEFIQWIESNPGYDVYFINPFPQLGYFHFNTWEQGEYWHPGLLKLADQLFKTAGLEIQTKNLPRNNKSTLLYSNYWVANERFWGKFMSFISKFTDAIESLEEKEKNDFFATAPHYAHATYYPFIFERMFSTFLNIDKSFKCLPYPYEKKHLLSQCANEFESLIINNWSELIDNWDNHDRNDHEVRKIFLNLEKMQKLFLTQNLPATYSPNNTPNFWTRLELSIKKYLDKR